MPENKRVIDVKGKRRENKKNERRKEKVSPFQLSSKPLYNNSMLLKRKG